MDDKEGDKSVSKHIVKCPKCNFIMKAIPANKWFCKSCGDSKEVKENEKALWKTAINHGGKQ